MSVTAIEKSLRKLPPKQLTTFLVQTILSLPAKSRKKIFHDLYVIEEMNKELEDGGISCCPANWEKLPVEKKYNADVIKSLEEGKKWSELVDKHENAKTPADRAKAKKELDLYEKKTGMIRYDSLDEMLKDLKS